MTKKSCLCYNDNRITYRLYIKLKRREPNQKEVILGILKFAAGTTALFTGAFVLSTFVIFKGNDFLTPNLTLEQINAMDEHNKHHQDVQGVMDVGEGLLGSVASTEVNKKIIVATSKTLDAEVKDLPEPLAHTH